MSGDGIDRNAEPFFDLAAATARFQLLDIQRAQQHAALVDKVKERLVEALLVGAEYRPVAAHAIVFEALALESTIAHVEERLEVLQALWVGRPNYPWDLSQKAEELIAAARAMTRTR